MRPAVLSLRPLPLVFDGLKAFLLKLRCGLRGGQGRQLRGLTAFPQYDGLCVTAGRVQVFPAAQQIGVQLWRINVALVLLRTPPQNTRIRIETVNIFF